MTTIERATEFAVKAHGDQKRKYTNEPYVNHCIAVSKLVASVTMNDDIIVAAILHDTLEDTPTTFDDLQREFGIRVATLVREVTDVSTPEDGNRRIRKAKDRKHLAGASFAAKTIKLADLIDNTSSIVGYDKEFAKVYMQEKRELLEVLKDGNPSLFLSAKTIVDNYFSTEKEV